ncbi:hypothetical protein LN650_10340 [Klebsiella pneumoniae subsp. pneumoniae]|nr:hypothetical protein [Klebsiella pneumoniae subsp. pneumoniae]
MEGVPRFAGARAAVTEVNAITISHHRISARGGLTAAGKIVLTGYSPGTASPGRTPSGTRVRVQLLGHIPERLAENVRPRGGAVLSGVDLNSVAVRRSW